MEISFVTTERSSFECAVIRVLPLAGMPDERWNGDIAYVFSIHKLCLEILGLWPLQKETVFARIRCAISFSSQITLLIFMTMDFTGSKQDAGTSIENILYFVTMILSLIKLWSVAFNQKKIRTNVSAAMDDWLTAKHDEETWKIMKKYAFRMKVLTLLLLYSSVGCYILYVSVVAIINLKQIFFTDPNSVNANLTHWMFLIPSGSLSNTVTGSQYVMILAVQIFQTSILTASQCIVDSFFFNLTVHLAGQLEVLKKKFKNFANKPYTVPCCRRRFVDLVNRHSELMEYYQNLEDTFHFLLLVQLTIVTVTLSLLGLRLNMYLNKNSQVEFMKNVLVINFLLIESLVYTYAADFLQRKSENIFHALYATSWFTLSLTLMRDLYFAMLKSTIPFRLTGGKFFYVNRETMMYILKTAFSYISVLRIALRD